MRRKVRRPDERCEVSNRENINALELNPEHYQAYLEIVRQAESYVPPENAFNHRGRSYEGRLITGELDTSAHEVAAARRKMFGKGTGKRWKRNKLTS